MAKNDILDFNQFPVKIDTIRARFPFHFLHEQYYDSPKLWDLNTQMNWLFDRLQRKSASKVGALDDEYLRALDLGWMIDDFDIFSVKADYDYSGDFPIPYLNFRRFLGEDDILLPKGMKKKKVVDVGYRVYMLPQVCPDYP